MSEPAPIESRDTGASATRVRLAARISSDYLLKTLILLRNVHGGDLLRAVIFQAISAANTAHLDQERARPDTEVGDVPADEARRPVSMLAIANGLGVPFETVRRHVNAMVAAGACQRISGGVIVPQKALAGDQAFAIASANYQNLARLFRDLRAVGIEF